MFIPTCQLIHFFRNELNKHDSLDHLIHNINKKYMDDIIPLKKCLLLLNKLLVLQS